MGTFGRRNLLTRSRVWAAVTALVAGSVLAISPIDAPFAVADTVPASSSTPATVSADPLPTVQQDGVVLSQVVVGDTVYATGQFTTTWPAGQTKTSSNQTARGNLLAYNITTGELTSFNHTLDQQGLGITVSPDGKTLYVVGDFTHVDGQTRNHIAAFSVDSGALLDSFQPSISGPAEAITVTNDTVYVGGNFFSVNGVTRTRLAAFLASNGSLLSWAPTADDNEVTAMVLSPDKSRVIVGGRFSTLNNTAVYGLGAVDSSSGKTLAFAMNNYVQDYHGPSCNKPTYSAGITSLTADATQVYGTGFSYNCGNFEGTFAANPKTGAPVWINDCHGDTYSTAPIGSVLYSAGHAHDCSPIGSFPNNSAPGYNQRALAETTYASGGHDTGPDSYGWNYNGQPDAAILHWFPTFAPGTVTHQDQAAWSVVGNGTYIAFGGEFPTVNGTAQAGLVRFAVRADAPNTSGPLPSSGLTPSVSSTSSGAATVSWTGTWDRDNQDLTYDVLRDGGTTPIATIHQSSTFWQLPKLTYTDSGLQSGSQHTYRIRVVDPLGNRVGGTTSKPVTVSGSNATTNAPSYTSSCSYLTCSFASSSASAQDASFAWDFGDGTTASGADVQHSFASAGSRPVTLSVSSGRSSTSTARQIRVSAQAPTIWANDGFNRNASGSWKSGKTGGPWTTLGTCRRITVGDGAGYLSLSPGTTCGQQLAHVSRTNTDTTTQVTTQSLSRRGVNLSILGRKVSASSNIALALILRPDGAVTATLQARTGGRYYALSKAAELKVGYAPRMQLRVRLQVSGTNPTRVAAKVWAPDASRQAEPDAWTVSGQTTLAALQHPGALGLTGYVPRTGDSAAVLTRVESFRSTSVDGS